MKIYTSAPASALSLMAYSPDPLVRDIAAEIDDRPADEIAQAIHDVVFGSDASWEDAGGEDPSRELGEVVAGNGLSYNEACEAHNMADTIISWANYGIAYGDFSSPPWERED